MAKTQLVAVCILALLGIAGCARRSAVDEDLMHSTATSTSNVSPPHEHEVPNGWPQTSAAYPTGWADQSERRTHEIEFAVGAEVPITPPNAIGGGPIKFEE